MARARWRDAGADAGSAVGGDGIIPARFVPQSVERMDVFEKTFARLRGRNRCAVKIDILLAVVCADADHVALIGHDVDEFELPVEAADGRVGLANLSARLDGEADRRRVSELKADDGMRDPGRAPVIDREVDAGDLRDAHGARFPMRGVVSLGPVVAVADVVEGDFVALNLRPRFLSHVGLPVASLLGESVSHQASTPAKSATKMTSFRQNGLTNSSTTTNMIASSDRCQAVARSEWSVKPYGTERPCHSNAG